MKKLFYVFALVSVLCIASCGQTEGSAVADSTSVDSVVADSTVVDSVAVDSATVDGVTTDSVES